MSIFLCRKVIELHIYTATPIDTEADIESELRTQTSLVATR